MAAFIAFAAGFSAIVAGTTASIPPDRWRCANQVEVWCTVDSCSAKRESETTPMGVEAFADGRFSVCAYTGCWEGKATMRAADGRVFWAANDVAFSSNDAASADVSIFIVQKEGVGFVRVGALATPMLCRSAGPRAAE